MTLEALDPPAPLDAGALEIWRETAPQLPTCVGAPAALAHLLEAYCRHVVEMRRVAKLIGEMQAGPDDAATLSKLLTIHSKAVADLARQLGLV